MLLRVSHNGALVKIVICCIDSSEVKFEAKIRPVKSSKHIGKTVAAQCSTHPVFLPLALEQPAARLQLLVLFLRTQA